MADPDVRDRIASLAIPPAWTDVWISVHSRAHLQATGRDDQGRKQYRYHPHWDEARDAVKFERLRFFGRALPRVRAGVDEALRSRFLNREKVLAAVVALLEATGIRVGNDEYARDNETFGLTTLRRRHIKVEGSRIDFRFDAKGRKEAVLSVRDPRLARVVAACRALPGHEVFKWIASDGRRRDVKSEDVNEFIRQLSGGDFTAKDFRTWLGTVQAFRHLCGCDEPEDERGAETQCVAAVDAVAEHLRNTRAVARASYVHPAVLELHRKAPLRRRFRLRASTNGNAHRLKPEERGLLALLDGSAEG